MKGKFVLLISLLVLLIACKQKLSKEEAEKQLRAFDNEVVLTAKNISETLAFQVLQKMATLKNLPLPFQYNSNNILLGKPCRFNFDELIGTYNYDNKCNLTVKKGAEHSIVILFPFDSKKNSVAKFVLSDYSEKLTLWNIYLPTKMNAQLFINNDKVADFYCEGYIEHAIPLDYKATSSFSNYKIETSLQTKLSKKKAIVNIRSSIFKDKNQLFQNSFRIKTTMNEQKQLVFNTIDSKMTVFPINMKIHIDRDKIPANTTQFIDQFNQNSTIAIYGNQGKSDLGKVKLFDRPNNDRLNFAIVYHDGTKEYLDDFLLTVRKILNIKL